MPNAINKRLIELGLKAATYKICDEDKIWSRYSKDKVDIGEGLAKVIRTLGKAMPLSKTLRALSIGSSAEPQFRILESSFRGGLYLLDVDKKALDIITERICRQCTDHVVTIHGDCNKIFIDKDSAEYFLKKNLSGSRVNLVTLHQSLYYSKKDLWRTIFFNIYRKVLYNKGAIHAVLMAAENRDPSTTTWLYNHFADKYFDHKNDQSLIRFKKELSKDRFFRNAQILSKTHNIRFFVDDFEKFMAVIWMVLLYPKVHRYSLKQREEITEFIYKRFWTKKRPLIQVQDHLAIYSGIGFKGLI